MFGFLLGFVCIIFASKNLGGGHKDNITGRAFDWYMTNNSLFSGIPHDPASPPEVTSFHLVRSKAFEHSWV